MGNQKVKVAVLAGMVSLVVAIIVWDRMSAPKETIASAPAETTALAPDTIVLAPEPTGLVGDSAPTAPGPVAQIPAPEHAVLTPITTPVLGNPMIPEPAPAPVAAASKTYVIQSGDSLWEIAKAEYGSGAKWSEIVKANPGLKDTAMEVGKKIVLPALTEAPKAAPAQTAVVAPAGAKTYVVQSGDSLEKIAREQYNDGRKWPKIFEANKAVLKNEASLKIGQTLVIPDLATEPAPAAPEIRLPGSEVIGAGTTTAPDGSKTHTVQAGDNLWKISRQYFGDGGKVDAIYQANKSSMNSASDLKVGQKLVIPQ